MIFAVKPAVEARSPARALVYGALFGFFTYATYDLTNLATIRDWPLIVTVVDLIWGTVLCDTVVWASYLAASSTPKAPQRYAWVTGLKPDKAAYYR